MHFSVAKREDGTKDRPHLGFNPRIAVHVVLLLVRHDGITGSAAAPSPAGAGAAPPFIAAGPAGADPARSGFSRGVEAGEEGGKGKRSDFSALRGFLAGKDPTT